MCHLQSDREKKMKTEKLLFRNIELKYRFVFFRYYGWTLQSRNVDIVVVGVVVAVVVVNVVFVIVIDVEP